MYNEIGACENISSSKIIQDHFVLVGGKRKKKFRGGKFL